jgi:hypothetical protein
MACERLPGEGCSARTDLIDPRGEACSLAAPDEMQPTPRLRGHKGDIDSVEHALGSDAPHTVVTCSGEDGTCRLWDLRSNHVVRCLARLPGLNHVMLSGHLLLAVAQNGEALHIDTRADSLVADGSARVLWRSTLCSDVLNQIDVSSDGTVAVCCDDNGTVHALHISSGLPVCPEKKIHTSLATSVSCRPNSSEVVSVGTGNFTPLCFCSAHNIPSRVDCRIRVWSHGVHHEHLPKSYLVAAEGERGSQLCNPPHIHHTKCHPKVPRFRGSEHLLLKTLSGQLRGGCAW